MRGRRATVVARALLCLLLPSVRGGGEGPTVRGAGGVLSSGAGGGAVCTARGDPPPAASWVGDLGTPITDTPYRRIHPNGTLEVVAWGGAGAGGGGGVRETVRCWATNRHGTAVAPDLVLQIVPTPASTQVRAARGAAAVLRCGASAPGARARWTHDGRPLPLTSLADKGSRYLSWRGWLVVASVSATDAGRYRCLSAAHDAWAVGPYIDLVVIEGTPAAPALERGAGEEQLAGGEQLAVEGQPTCLLCVSDQPDATYTWLRVEEGPIEEGAVRWGGGAALCWARAGRGGVWRCEARSARGRASATHVLRVQPPLSVRVEPKLLVVEAGATAQLSCVVTDAAATTSWLHDGAPAGGGRVLRVRGAARAHAGVYQCVARRGDLVVHAAAEVRLSGTAPELRYTFIEQALHGAGAGAGGGGGEVSLRCAAAGEPPPAFSWLLDDRPLETVLPPHRFSVTSERGTEGGAGGEAWVWSRLVIRGARASEGGRYTCRAHNTHGTAQHAARLNIYGGVTARGGGIARAVAGSDAVLRCPYAGYPISSVRWWARDTEVPQEGGAGEGARAVAAGAELRLKSARAADAGRYACEVRGVAGDVARAEFDVLVLNPPKIVPFQFPSELSEGAAAQALCGVTAGDQPLRFSWLKDGAPLPPSLQVSERSMDQFSLLVFPALSARHAGAYTCRVANHVASVDYTTMLDIRVGPSWTMEPQGTAAVRGGPLALHCAAAGHPSPAVTWQYRSEGGTWRGVALGAGGWSGGTEGELRARASPPLAGEYRCRGDNGVGTPIEKIVNVTVFEPPQFLEEEAEWSARNTSARAGALAVLRCAARGDSPLALYWTRHGERLRSNIKWSVSTAMAATGARSELLLRNAVRSDAGEYRCHADNVHGRVQITLYLDVEEPPPAPKGLRLRGVEARRARVTWRGGGVQEHYSALLEAVGLQPYHMNLTVDHDVFGTEQGEVSAMLQGLRPATAYSVRLTVRSRAGASAPSVPLQLVTLTAAPDQPPGDVRVSVASDTELLVTWTAPPVDSWNGEPGGYAVYWQEEVRAPPPEQEEGGGDEGDPRRRGQVAVVGGVSGGGRAVLSGLRAFSRYTVTVRALTAAGPGPAALRVSTSLALPGVPSSAPVAVSCEASSSRTLLVRWVPSIGEPVPITYDLHYALIYDSPTWTGVGGGATWRAGVGVAASLPALRPGGNYSVRVAGRGARGAGPLSAPAFCFTPQDVPGAPRSLRAARSANEDLVLAAWLPPEDSGGGHVTHYTLYITALSSGDMERTQRVEAPSSAGEVRGAVRGLWRGALRLRVAAHSRAGASPPSEPFNVPTLDVHAGARVWSTGGRVRVTGGAARLPCAALGAEPLTRTWRPLPRRHTRTEEGDLLLTGLEESTNFTCRVSNAWGADEVRYEVVVDPAPIPLPAPRMRLMRAEQHALLVTWDTPTNSDRRTPLGYTLRWSREAGPAGGEVRGARGALWLAGLSCAARYRLELRAHYEHTVTHYSPPLFAETTGDSRGSAPAHHLLWSNSSCVRVNLAAWRGCRRPAPYALRSATPDLPRPWQDLDVDGDLAQVCGLRAGVWFEVRVGEVFLYRVATRSADGESLGPPVSLTTGAEESESPLSLWTGGAAWWAGGAVLVLAGVTVGAFVRRAPKTPALPRSPPPLYSTEPRKNGKLPDISDEEGGEISPYATFSMSELCAGAGAEAGAAPQLLPEHEYSIMSGGFDAPPPREGRTLRGARGRGARDSDSSSSGSPCAACAAERLPPPPAYMTGPAGAGAAGGRRGRGRTHRTDRAARR